MGVKLEISSNPMTGHYPLTLCAFVHDEMYFLPAFFAHYRKHGVRRFIILDDASQDGTAEFLAAQPDCMVLRSDVRYFDQVDGQRALYAWRQALLDRFCEGQWTIVADADEFLLPPPGLDFGGVTARLEAAGSDTVWGVMLDMYPSTIGELLDGRAFRLEDPWFFDGRRHMLVRPGRKKPVSFYRGSRARLMGAMRMTDARMSPLKRMAVRLGLGGFVKVNVLHKAPLVRWRPGYRFVGSHQVEPFPKTPDLLAILHFKFTADLGRKVSYALASGGYVDGSRQYSSLAELIARMQARDAGFLCGASCRLVDGSEPYRTGAAYWGGGGT